MASGPMATWLWLYGPMAPYSCLKNFGVLTRYHIFLFRNRKGYIKIFSSFETSSCLDKIPDLKSEITFDKLPPLPLHKHFDFLLDRITLKCSGHCKQSEKTSSDNFLAYLHMGGGGGLCPPGSFFATAQKLLALDC